MIASAVPPLPRDFRGRLETDPGSLTPWSGASGPFWRPPRAVVLPVTVEDVQHVVTWARRNGLSLVPRGAGTGMPGGNVGPFVVLDLSRLDGVDDPDDDPRRLRAGAGAVAATLRQAARSRGMDLPALPSSASWCTVGGMLACNAAGARSLRYGSARAWTLEVEVVLADGTRRRLGREEDGAGAEAPWSELHRHLWDSLPDPLPWPQVRKNSSGYALDAFLASGSPVDLVVGAEGSLAVITEATLRLEEPPEARAVLLLGVPTLDSLMDLSGRARADERVLACEYMGRRLVELGGLEDREELAALRLDQGLLLVEVAGDRAAVAAGAEDLSRWAPGGVVEAFDDSDRERLWRYRHAANPTLARALEEGRRSTQFIEDCVVPVDRMPDFIRGLGRILAARGMEAVLFGHAGDGNLHVNVLVPLERPTWREEVAASLEETVDLVADLGGTLAGEHGDGRLRTPFLDRIFHPAVIRAFGTVKERLDPRNVLNPGVVVPLPGSDPLAGLGAAPGFDRGTQGPETRG